MAEKEHLRSGKATGASASEHLSGPVDVGFCFGAQIIWTKPQQDDPNTQQPPHPPPPLLLALASEKVDMSDAPNREKGK